MPPKEKQKIIDTIGKLGNRVTVADVATEAGLPVLTVSQILNVIASETGGHLQVSESGDIAYQFYPGFSAAYLTRGIARMIEQIVDYAVRIGYYILKISFGIMLILSLLIVVLTVCVFVYIQMSQSRDRDDGELFAFDLGIFDFIWLQEIFYWGSQSVSDVVYDYSRPTVRLKKNKGFLLNCFSFLFGDGDPNEGLDQKSWQLIANIIKQNNYVLTAEQLAPYASLNIKSDNDCLPVLVRFNGKPEVTESGNIVYTFPELATTALATREEKPTAYLQEFPWKFTEAPMSDMMPVIFLACANLFGTYFIWHVFHKSPSTSIVILFNVLFAYGILFGAMPCIRLLIQTFLNKDINKRNTQRLQYAEILRSPDDKLQKKLIESSNYKVSKQLINNKDLAYTTESNVLDQEDDLDRKFKVVENQSVDVLPK